MGKRRSRIEIIADMLDAIKDKGGEIKPTHLMYRSNMSHPQMTGYLEELIEKHFVEKISKDTNDYIIITDKGLEFLQKILEIKEFEDAFGL